jgi:hypothetical protein
MSRTGLGGALPHPCPRPEDRRKPLCKDGPSIAELRTLLKASKGNTKLQMHLIRQIVLVEREMRRT